MLEVISAFFAKYGGILLTGTRDTVLMVVISPLFAYVLGLPLGVALTITGPHGIRPNKTVNRILGWIVNIGRSIPFIILMVMLFPATRAILGRGTGTVSIIIPLTVSAFPYVARMVESAAKEVDAGVIEAAQAMGCTNLQIIWHVLLPEAKPSLISGSIISTVTILSYTALAATLGGTGLGQVAIRPPEKPEARRLGLRVPHRHHRAGHPDRRHAHPPQDG